MIHLTAEEILTSVIIYGIVHSIWSGIKWFEKQVIKEAKLLVKNHRHITAEIGQLQKQGIEQGW